VRDGDGEGDDQRQRELITRELDRRSRSALAITEKELRLIAALAIIGLRSRPKNG